MEDLWRALPSFVKREAFASSRMRIVCPHGGGRVCWRAATPESVQVAKERRDIPMTSRKWASKKSSIDANSAHSSGSANRATATRLTSACSSTWALYSASRAQAYTSRC